MSTPVPPEADTPPFLLCVECAKSEHLKRFIGRVGHPNLRCNACLHTDEKCTPPEAQTDLVKVIRSLIRLYYDEAAYNRHVGGDELETLLLQENAILKTDGEDGRPRDSAAISDFIYKATCDAYADYDKGISLHAGYFDGLPNLHLTALATSRSHLFTDLRQRLRQTNYFELEAGITPLLQELAPHLAKSIPAETVFFRARIGVDGRYLNFEEPFSPRRVYHPYLEGKIGAPPPPLAAAGRVNRQGVSFLYLATDEQTAAASRHG